MKWTVTNDKGFRREFQDGVHKQLPKINCLSQTDSKTGIVTKIREDNVVLIKYPDGNTYCQHADGTQIFCQKGKEQVRIEKEGFAPVMHQMTVQCDDEEEWWETAELKSTSGTMSQVELPDGATVKTIMFQKSKQIQEPIMRHIIQRQDYSCVIIDNDGDFKIITTNARSAINQEDERARLGLDSDYLKQMYKEPGEFTPGVFYGRLSHVPSECHVTVKDFEKPFRYILTHENTLKKVKIADFEKNTDWETNYGSHSFEAERDIETIGQSRNPFTCHFIFPRMFIIGESGDGVELLSREQVEQIIKNTHYKSDYLTTQRVEYVDNTQLNNINVLKKVSTLAEQQLANQKMGKLDFPEYAEPFVIGKKSESELKALRPMQDFYRFWNISEYTRFEPLKQNAFLEDYQRFKEWKMSQLRYDTEFGIVHLAPKEGSIDMDEIEDNEFYAKRINFKIYTQRALQKKPFDPQVLKNNFVR